MLGLCCCAQVFSSYGEQGLLSSYSLVYELLIAAVSLVEGMGTQ